MNHTVDVILTVYKKSNNLKRQLEALCEQTVSVQKVIVSGVTEVLNAMDQAALKEADMVLSVPEKNAFPGTLFNLGLKECDAERIFFLDEGAIPVRNDLIEILDEDLKDEKIPVSYGHPVSSDEVSYMSRAMQSYMFQDESFDNTLKEVYRFGMKSFMLRNDCALYKKEAFRELGEFQMIGISHPEYLWQARAIYAGYKVHYNAEARVESTMVTTWKNAFQRSFDHGALQSMYAPTFGLNVQMIYGAEDKRHYPILNTTMGDIYRKQKGYALEYVKTHGGGLNSLSVRLVYILKRLGFKAGNYYHRLPVSLIRKFSASDNYWKE